MKISTAMVRRAHHDYYHSSRTVCFIILSCSAYHPELRRRITMYRSMYHPELVEGWFDGLTMIVMLFTSHFLLFTSYWSRERRWRLFSTDPLWSGCGNANFFRSLTPFLQDAIGDFFDMLLKDEPEVASSSIICRCHEMHAIGMMGELITFFK